MPFVNAVPGDEPGLQRWLSRDPYFNLFLIANLDEGLGENLEVWVQEGVGVLMRRRHNWVVDPGPEPGRFDVVAAAAIVDSFDRARVRTLVGRPEGVDPLCARLRHRGQAFEQRFAVLERVPAPIPYAGTPRPATSDDLEQLVSLYADADDMSRPRESVERQLPRQWVVNDQGIITSAAVLSAETIRAAMIGGVFTPPRYRRRGYASTVVHALASSVVARGRAACLFYHSPEAGQIYLRLGFEELGPWRTILFR